MKIFTSLSPILLLIAVVLFNACDKEVMDTTSKVKDVAAAQDTLPVATVVAGTTTAGYQDGPAARAQFTQLIALATGSDGAVYILEPTRIRKLKDGVVSTVAGTGTPGYKNGPCETAQFKNLKSIGVCKDGTVYILDDNRIRKITPGGMVSTYVTGSGIYDAQDGPLKEATFRYMRTLAVSQDGTIFLSESGSDGPEGHQTILQAIRKITPEGLVSTIFKDTRYQNHHGGSVENLYAQPSGDLYIVQESTRMSSYRISKFTPDGKRETVHGSSSYILARHITVTTDNRIYVTLDLDVIYNPFYNNELGEGDHNQVAIFGDYVEYSEEGNPDGIGASGGLANFGDDVYVGYGTQLKKVTIP